MSDAALVSLLALFFIRNAFLTGGIEANPLHYSNTVITPVDFLGDFIYSSFSYFSSSSSSSYSSFQFTQRWQEIFSFNGIINLVIALIAISSPFSQIPKSTEEV